MFIAGPSSALGCRKSGYVERVRADRPGRETESICWGWKKAQRLRRPPAAPLGEPAWRALAPKREPGSSRSSFSGDATPLEDDASWVFFFVSAPQLLVLRNFPDVDFEARTRARPDPCPVHSSTRRADIEPAARLWAVRSRWTIHEPGV